MDNATKALIIRCAKDGCRIRFTATGAEKTSTIWGGLGNRSGLHSFAYELLSQKWEKSGARFEKKLDKLPAGKLELQDFHNVNRDRGKWHTFKRIEVQGA